MYQGIEIFGQGTIKDPFLVRKYADVLSKRLSESYGHLVCFAILAKRRTERGIAGGRKLQKKMIRTEKSVLCAREIKQYINQVAETQDNEWM